MLQQIVLKTPLWVWPLLAFLVYRGIASSVDREITLTRLFIIPAVLLALSILGIATTFGANAAAAPVWFACLIASTALTWHFFNSGSVVAYPERRAVFQRGSWMPMALIMGIFCTKYAVGAALATAPELKQHAAFIAVVCALYGLFNGVYIGRVLRVVSIYRQTGLVRS